MHKSKIKEEYPEEYKILMHKWASMKARCANPNSKNYINYGGRGITVCNEWKHFSDFFKWSINNGYKLGLSLDRIYVNKGYFPDNCRYITLEEQQRNKRNNRAFIDPFDGQKLCLAAIAKKYNIPEDTFRKRVDKYKMPLEKALTKPYDETTRWIIVNDPLDGERLCLTELARKYGMNPSTLNSRLRNKWSLEDAICTPIKKGMSNKNALL